MHWAMYCALLLVNGIDNKKYLSKPSWMCFKWELVVLLFWLANFLNYRRDYQFNIIHIYLILLLYMWFLYCLSQSWSSSGVKGIILVGRSGTWKFLACTSLTQLNLGYSASLFWGCLIIVIHPSPPWWSESLGDWYVLVHPCWASYVNGRSSWSDIFGLG